LNPVAAGLVERASDYPWSSYRAYVGKAAAPHWLHSSFILALMGQNCKRARYQSFVVAGIDEETATFFGKKKLSQILGDDACSRTRSVESE